MDARLLLLAKCLVASMGVLVLGGLVWIVVIARRMRRAATAPVPLKTDSVPAAYPELCQVARREALRCFHGRVCGLESTLQPILSRLPSASEEAGWSAAFVYHCVQLSKKAKSVDVGENRDGFASVWGWENWATEHGLYLGRGESGFALLPGDLVLYASPSEHMGIVLSCDPQNNGFTAAEGDVCGMSAVVDRRLDSGIRGCIRLS